MPRTRRPNDSTLVVAYSRTSTTDQPNSPAAQRDAIDRYAKTHGLRVVARFEDKGVSGGSPAMDRPGFAAAVDALAQHAAGALIVAKRDRLGRDVVEVGLATRLVERLGAKVLAADGSGNGDGPEAALLRGVVDVFAQYERAIIRARTRAALASRRARNLKFSRWAPFGFVFDRHGRMRAVPKQQATLARMRALRRRGHSYAEIGRRLDAAGHGPARARAWTIGMVRTLCLRQEAPTVA
jgi:site-specific DNA recombinase